MRNNINIVLCEKVTNNVSNILNIFDVITMDQNNRISFTAVIFVNGIEWDIKQIGLYFYLYKIDEQLVSYLGSTELKCSVESKKRSNGSWEYGSHRNNSQLIAEQRFDKLYVPGPGDYEIQIYMYEEDEIVDLSKKSLSECIEYAKDDKLVSVYSFAVE